MTRHQINIVREPGRLAITGVSRPQWWRLERAGKAPSRVHLGKHSVGWLQHELEAWLMERAAERDDGWQSSIAREVSRDD